MPPPGQCLVALSDAEDIRQSLPDAGEDAQHGPHDQLLRAVPFLLQLSHLNLGIACSELEIT